MSNLCAGETDSGPVQFRNSQSYCEGREAAANGELVGTNPHLAGSEAAEAWTRGFNSWAANPATMPDQQDCCARAYGGGYTP